MNRTTRLLTAAISMAVVALPAFSANTPPDEWDGLHKTKVKGIDLAYVRPGANLSSYTKVMVDPVQVAFSKEWNPERTGSRIPITQADRDKIKKGLEDLATKTFGETLSKDNGYPVVTAPAPDVMRMSAALIDVYINAPDVATAGRSRTYVMDAGHMTLVMELRDSETNALFARAVDNAVGTDMGYLQLSSGVENSAEAKAAFRKWADILRKRMDAVHNHPNTPAAQ